MPLINSGVWVSGIFCLKMYSNNKAVIQMADNFLDFPRVNKEGLSPITVSYHINTVTRLKYTSSGVPLQLASSVHAGAVLFVLSGGKAYASVHFDTGRVEAVVEDINSIKLEPLTDFLFFQTFRQIALRHNLFALHASVVQKNSKVFIMTGPQNSGKSTVAASLMRKGYKILADDDCFFSVTKDKLKLFPFPTRMGFKEAGSNRFLEFHPFLVDGFVYGQKKRFSLKSFYSKAKSSYLNCAVLFPNHSKVRNIKLKALSSKSFLERIIKENLPIRLRRDFPGIYFESFLAFRFLVKLSRGYELLYNDSLLDKLLHIKDEDL